MAKSDTGNTKAVGTNPSWKSGTGHVVESRLNSGGDSKFGTGKKAHNPGGKKTMKY
jgi:hypothetical protein